MAKVENLVESHQRRGRNLGVGLVFSSNSLFLLASLVEAYTDTNITSVGNATVVSGPVTLVDVPAPLVEMLEGCLV